MEHHWFIAFWHLGMFLVLAAQWIGFLGLAKTGKNQEWWCMAAGTCLATIGRLSGSIFYVFTISDPYLGAIIGGLSFLGMILFAVGFAIHGNRTSRIRGHIIDLELMNLAQARELERLRNS